MKIMQGQFKYELPYKEININNLKLRCKCRFITVRKMENKIIEFMMEPKCHKHLLKYAEWKLKNRVIDMNGLQLEYKWNEYSDGSMGVIK